MAFRGMGASAAALAILAIGAPAWAQKSARSRADADCRSAYEAANEHMGSGQLREASHFLQTCAKMQCQSVLQRHCLATYLQLESTDIPTIIPVAKDASGAERHDVQVMMDHEVLATEITGAAIPVDPGLHEFSFSLDGQVFATERVIVAQGQRNRTIAVSMRKSGAGAPEASRAAVPATPAVSGHDESAGAPAAPGSSTPEGSAGASSAVSPWAFAAGGVAGGGTVALLVLSGKSDTSTVLTDVSIGFSFGALVVAAWVLLTDRLKHDAAPPRAASAVDVRSSSSGAVVSFLHAF